MMINKIYFMLWIVEVGAPEEGSRPTTTITITIIRIITTPERGKVDRPARAISSPSRSRASNLKMETSTAATLVYSLPREEEVELHRGMVMAVSAVTWQTCRAKWKRTKGS
jgi:hypothetical protein